MQILKATYIMRIEARRVDSLAFSDIVIRDWLFTYIEGLHDLRRQIIECRNGHL